MDDDECVICFEEIGKNDVYAMIDREGETGKYHVKCIENWLKTSTNGILIQSPIEKVNLYFEDKICGMKLYVPDNFKTNDSFCEDVCCNIM